tara:strand:- start:56 stop:721 length:666 start_codon:yes stop_codon:yes gene_type:complete
MSNIKNNVSNNLKIWDNVDTWIKDGEEWSEHFGSTDELWAKHIFNEIKDHLRDQKVVLEIAPGRGRLTRKLLEHDIRLNILDLSQTCIDRCRERFGDNKKLENCYVGSGSDLKDIETNSIEFVFSFDSFVHMHEEVISSYLSEINRVLKLGGHCWIHHSILTQGNNNNFQNIAGRSNMDLGKFANLAKIYNLKVIKQKTIKWDAPGNPDWLYDGFTLIKKQ